MSQKNLPPALQQHSDEDSVYDDIAPYIGTSVDERAEIISALCRLAAEQISARPDGARILEHQDRRSPESERLWLRLIEAAR
jgi:hypothetical protein